MDIQKEEYEYNISKKLYEKYNEEIKDELLKVISGFLNTIINLLKTRNPNPVDEYYSDVEKLNYIKKNIFISNFIEYGHIGSENPEITKITDVHELLGFIKQFNIRELLTVIKNFQREKEMNCLMYEMLIEYKKNKEEFKIKYNNINITHVEKIIKTIEKLMDFKIEETDECYNTEYDPVKCDGDKKKIYIEMNDDTNKYENEYPRLCNLWIPTVYLFSHQSLIKEQKFNRLKNLLMSFEKLENNKECTKEVFSRLPFIEPLSERETLFLKSDLDKNELPYKLYRCSFSKKKTSFYLKLRLRKNKLSLSHSSGHALLILLMSDYIKDIKMIYIILACIIWTVPYNHAINEILSSSKQYELFEEYDYDKDILENINILLNKFGLEPINLD